MMARSHLTVGACVVAVGSVTGLIPWAEPGVAAVCAGLILAGSDWPDLDHRRSVVTIAWGPLTWLLCRITRLVSRLVYRATRTNDDPLNRDPHRTFTHTFPGAMLAGGLITVALVAHPVSTVVTMTLLMGGAMRAWGRDLQPWGAIAGAVLGYGMAPVMPSSWWIWWVAFTVGCLTHVYSDCVTKEGAPLSWPVTVTLKERSQVTGESPVMHRARSPRQYVRRWHSVGPPRWLRFYTGGRVEVWVVRLVVVFTLFVCYVILN